MTLKVEIFSKNFSKETQDWRLSLDIILKYLDRNFIFVFSSKQFLFFINKMFCPEPRRTVSLEPAEN